MDFWTCVLWFSVGAIVCYLVGKMISIAYENGYAEGASENEDKEVK